jgi:nucleoside-diphosphate-sugar epimerase
MRQALITGATGFVGSRLVPALLDAGVACRCLVRSEERAAALPAHPLVTHAVGDITAPETLAGVADGCDVVYHLAAEGHVSAQSEEAFQRFMAVNVAGTEALIRSAAASGGVERFVHFSSTAAMGLIEKPLVSEEDEPQPLTPYQKSKRQSELTALAVGRETGVPVVVVRPCMIYGVGGLGEFEKMAKLMRKGRFPKVGRGRNLTPIVHVDDVAQAAVKAGERGVPYETYLVASARSPELDELRTWIMEGWGESAFYPYVPVWFMLSAAWGFELLGKITGKAPMATRRNIANTVYDREFSIEKARRDLGYEPAVELREGCMETVRWFKEQGQ